MKLLTFISHKTLHETPEIVVEHPQKVNIEVLGRDNQWRRVNANVPGDPQSIARAIQYQSKFYPRTRIRAVDSKTGALVDMTIT